MKKGDIILCAAILVVAAALAVVFFAAGSEGKTVIVKVDNKTVAEYPLDTDKTVNLEHNTAVIKNGEVFMSEADCKNHVCINTGKISKKGECIVCLPNRVIIEIK